MVMTAGLGTRLRPLTYARAKPAVPVAGEALARRILRWLGSQGVTDAVLNLHHEPASIRDAVGDGAGTGVRVIYSSEDPVLGSAGGPRHALPLLAAERFFIVNGDTLTDLDLGLLLDAHERTGALITMALVPNPAAPQYGGVEIDQQGAVTRFARPNEAGPGAHLFIGVQVVEARAFSGLADGVPAETVRWLYPALVAARPGSVRGVLADAEFLDIGTPDDYLTTSLALAARESHAVPLVGRGCTIDARARIERSVLWDDVKVEAGVRLTECVVTDGVRVPAGTVLSRAVLTRRGRGPSLPASTMLGDILVTPL